MKEILLIQERKAGVTNKFRATVLVLMVLSLVTQISVVQAALIFYDTGFTNTWNRADKAVAESVGTKRGYTWGPTIGGSESVFNEPYNNTTRRVQYFDKARMEVNNPTGDNKDLYYVTTGLLVKELVTGKRQDGDNSFASLQPSTVQVAGDSNLDGVTNVIAPTYLSFAKVGTYFNDENSMPDARGMAITSKLDKAGTVTTITPPEQRRNKGYDDVTKHNIADVFVDFGNQKGSIWNGSAYVSGDVMFGNPTYVLGRPVTEPYWMRAVVAGVERDVLVQLFERRVLTYTPANPAGFKVEMGNVGQHYFVWRYLTLTTPTPLLFPPQGSNRHFGGNSPVGGTANFSSFSTVPSHYLLDINDDNTIAVLSRQLDSGKWEVFALNLSDDPTKMTIRWRFESSNFNLAYIFNKVVYYFENIDNKLTAFDLLTGQQLWRYESPNNGVNEHLFGRFLTDGIHIYLSSGFSGANHGNTIPTKFVALNIQNGKEAWLVRDVNLDRDVFEINGVLVVKNASDQKQYYNRSGQKVEQPIAPAPKEKTYRLGSNCDIAAYDSSGREVDKTNVDSCLAAIIAHKDGKIYAVGFKPSGAPQNRVYAFDANNLSRVLMVANNQPSPLDRIVTDNYLYVLDNQAKDGIYQLNLTNFESKTLFETDKEITAFMVVNSRVYFTSDRKFYTIR